MRIGFFGWSPANPPQPRWLKGRDFESLNLVEACAAAGPALRRFWLAQAHPSAPAYSGGVLDAWPGNDAVAFASARAELEVIEAVQAIEARRARR